MLVSKATQVLNLVRSFSEIDWSSFRNIKDIFSSTEEPRGLYEVLEYRAKLELSDFQGREARYQKTQTVRFLQDNIIAYQDKAWGDGDIFIRYECSPGQAVDCYREGAFYRVLISLRGAKQRGDEETFHINREIHDGFMHEEESWQTDVDHQTNYLRMEIIFPSGRPPKQITLIEQNAQNSEELNRENYQFLPDGRTKVFWETDAPKLFESYILKWVW